MEAKEIKDIVENVKDKSNKVLIECRDELGSEFKKTQELIINLTHHLDAVQKSYEIVNKEIGERTV